MMKNNFQVCICVDVEAYNSDHAALIAEEALKRETMNLTACELEVREQGGKFFYTSIEDAAKKLAKK